jgi:GTPase SAR1 family protein
MTIDINSLFQPCQPHDFYGLRETINNFTEFINKKKRGESEVISFLIVGDEGTGKSSLLHRLETTATGRKDIAYRFELVPNERALLDFFKEWKNQIDELSPDWRSLLEKVGKKRLGDDLPGLDEEVKKPANVSYTEFYVNLFLENLDKINQKLVETSTFLYFFIDNLHLFKLMDLYEFYPIFASIIKELKERQFNIIVTSTFNERFLYDFDYEKYLTNNSKVLKVDTLSISETEIYLRRKAPEYVNKGVLDLITTSQRSIFDLNLGIAFISKGLGIENFVERNLKDLFDLTEEEETALLEMASYNENLFPIEQLSAYISIPTLKKLEEKGILWMGERNARFLQESLLTTMKFRIKLFGPLTTLMVQLDNILNNLDKDIAPSTGTIETIIQLSAKIREPLADFAIASKVKQIANVCIEKKMFQRAYDFSLINVQQFEAIKELEQAGGFCENMAREFEEKNYYFAAKLYVKSAEYYDAVNEELKAKRSYTRAADQFEKLALSLPLEKSEYAIRGYIKSTLDCYNSIGDEVSFERIRKKAIDLYNAESIHHNYFKSMKFEKAVEVELPQVEPEPEPEPEPEKVEEIEIESIEKELDF